MIAEICVLLAATGVLVAISVADARKRVIPNEFVAALGMLWIARVGLCAWRKGGPAAFGFAAEGMAGFLLVGLFLLVVAGVYEKICGKQSLGGGDIKLLAVLGLYLGAAGSAASLALACLASAAFSLVTKRQTFPFGPFISAASLPFLWLCSII